MRFQIFWLYLLVAEVIKNTLQQSSYPVRGFLIFFDYSGTKCALYILQHERYPEDNVIHDAKSYLSSSLNT